MAKPFIHSQSSVKRFGGKQEDYEAIHNWMDSSKSFMADNRHRALWHSSAGIFYVEKIFGINFTGINKLKEKYNLPDSFEEDMISFLKESQSQGDTIKNSDGKLISVRDIAEQHVLEDFGMRYIPSAQDYLQEMEMKSWMNNGMGEPPTSFKKIENNKTVRFIKAD
jgi:hypothetical protein